MAQKILVVVGTRPEVIKMAPVIRRLHRDSARFRTTICSSGQQRDLLAQAFGLFNLQPDVDFNLMEPGQSPNALGGRLLIALDALLAAERPDWVLVQGDTTTAMTGALAAFHRRIRIGHVEAGLRTGDLQAPFPEELNRRIADLAADWLFAPTPAAGARLQAEGVPPPRILVTGNTVVDALLDVAAQSGPVQRENLVLVTAHRRENLGAGLERIVEAVQRLAVLFPRTTFAHIAHPNPQVAAVVERLPLTMNLRVVPPVAYPAFVRMLRRARLVLTDSGGVQEEAATFATPVLVLRDRSERIEGMATGIARLVGTDVTRIVDAAAQVLSRDLRPLSNEQAMSPYGDGRAADRIVRTLAGEVVSPFAGVAVRDHTMESRRVGVSHADQRTAARTSRRSASAAVGSTPR